MEEVNELIKRYGLEEDLEHVIIPIPGPIPGKDGRVRRCFLLKRRFIRIAYPDGHYIDHPLAKAIEATIRHPELSLSKALDLIQIEIDKETLENTNDKEERK